VASKHTVVPGDWIGAIANLHGFAHWAKIWDHGRNEALRALRSSPDMLMVGDEVHIPGPEDEPGVDVPTGRRVVFVARRPTDVLRLRVTGVAAFVASIGPIDFELEIGADRITGTIEHEGQVIEAPLHAAAQTCALTLAGSRRLEYAIGGIGPVDEQRGAHARVVNLGFDAEAPAAFTTYQRLHGLEPSGVADEATRQRIREQYGD
jgi:hypothetical protein